MSDKIRRKKVFISGPMSGIKDFNKPAFDQAEQWLTHAGYSVFNPARMHFDDSWTHEQIMRIDLAALTQCDYIYMLDKWYNSKGALEEYHYAMATGIILIPTHDIKCPKKESKPGQYIEIETYGDISGENVDFLKWVEKHCNEILAKGGKLTEAVEVQIDSTTEHILRMMAFLNGHKPPIKSCGTCKHNNGFEPLRTCSDCGPFKNWEPKEDDSVKKSCGTCKYENGDSYLGRCLRCNSFEKWEPKDAEK